MSAPKLGGRHTPRGSEELLAFASSGEREAVYLNNNLRQGKSTTVQGKFHSQESLRDTNWIRRRTKKKQANKNEVFSKFDRK